MTSSTGVIIFTVLYTVLGYGLVLNMYRKRKNFWVAARSPQLAILSGTANVTVSFIILVQQIFAIEKLQFPCAITTYMSYLYTPLIMMPYTLRGIRVLVALSPDERKSMTWLLSSKAQAAVLSVATALMLVGGTLEYQLLGNSPDDCILFDSWDIFIPILSVYLGASLAISTRLIEQRDRLHMAPELMWVFMAFGFLGSAYFFFLVLRSSLHQENNGEIHDITLFNVIVIAINLIMLVASFSPGRVSTTKTSHMVKIDADVIARWTEQWTSVTIMHHPQMGAAYTTHVQKSLCIESYLFLKEADAYQNSADTVSVGDRHARVTAIIKKFLTVGSPFEVNIQAAMRNRIVTSAAKANYIKLKNDERQQILMPAFKEIASMLDQNLLPAFRTSRSYVALCIQIDISLMESSVTNALDIKSNHNPSSQGFTSKGPRRKSFSKAASPTEKSNGSTTSEIEKDKLQKPVSKSPARQTRVGRPSMFDSSGSPLLKPPARTSSNSSAETSAASSKEDV